jgi:hypothetical protein
MRLFTEETEAQQRFIQDPGITSQLGEFFIFGHAATLADQPLITQLFSPSK